MLKKLPVPIGDTIFREVCVNNYYVDKTLLIKDIIDEGTKVMLFTRPRRFGKSLNMDMLKTFFEKTAEDTARFFMDKKIWQQGKEYTDQQGKYPVIFISLKDIKADNWETALEILKGVVADEYVRHDELETSTLITKTDATFYQRIINLTASAVDYMRSIQVLSRMLCAHYKKKPIIIIDEYDTPIQEGYINGYYNEAISFLRNFFSTALKDNPCLTFSVLTGILRIGKESIFSGLNNIRIYSVLDKKYSAYFGFTIDEVKAICEYYNASEKLIEIKEWYDGYKFGETEIFNPWSVLSYFDNQCQAIPFWSQTSANVVISEIIENLSGAGITNLKKIIEGYPVESVIRTDIIYPSLKDPQTNILGFLLMTGYLKSTETTIDEDGAYVCKLEIPNKEIKSIYRQEILSLTLKSAGESIVENLKKSLMSKDAELLKNTLKKFLLNSISYYDGLKENYYHGLLLGMSVIFSSYYYPLSNRESGEGRYDIQLTPKEKNMPGIIIEIKASDKASYEDLRLLAESALEQINNKKYDTDLIAMGIESIYKYGIAFNGKHVEVISN